MRVALCACIAVGLGGCGLIDKNVTDFDLSLPNKTYTVDSASFDITGDPDVVLMMSCTPASGACELAGDQACPEGQCWGECSTSTSLCELVIPVHPFTTVNLADEKPELATIDEQSLVDVRIDTITYAVSENTMNRQTPPLVLYVAPANVTSPMDQAAVPVGTIPPVDPGVTIPVTSMEMTTGGRARLVSAMEDFRTPFNVLLATDITLRSGEPVPMGRMTTTLSITAHAGI
jgi:hypothetical protein